MQKFNLSFFILLLFFSSRLSAQCDTALVIFPNTDTLDVCNGDSGLLTVNYPDSFNFQWYLDGLAIANSTDDSLWVSDPGNYSIIAQSPSQGCIDTAGPVTVVNSSPPDAAYAGFDQEFCDEPTANMFGASPQIGTGTWSIISGGGNIINLNDPNSFIVGLVNGPSVFEWTVTNGSCAPSRDTVTLNNHPEPTAAFSYVVNEDTVIFTDGSSGGLTSWTWTFGDNGTSTTPSPTHVYSSNGTYTACLTVLDTNACNDLECENILIDVKAFLEEANTPDWEIGPNPTQNTIMIRLPQAPLEPMHGKILDLNGKWVDSFVVKKQNSLIPLDTLPPGTWILELGAKRLKFVVIR